MNLTTARSARRANEIGVRKVVGAQRYQLVRQFLGESFGLTLLGFVFAVGLVELIGPSFDAAFSTNLDVARILPRSAPLFPVRVQSPMLRSCENRHTRRSDRRSD